jgi:hypothetical protein
MIADWNKLAEERIQLRKANLNAQKARPDASFFKQLDSSIQKNTKFVQRIRRFAEVQLDQKRAIVPEVHKNTFATILTVTVAKTQFKTLC